MLRLSVSVVAKLSVASFVVLLSLPASTYAQAVFTGIGDLPGGGHTRGGEEYEVFHSSANTISGDGRVIVGHSASSLGQQVVRWTWDGGLMAIPDLTVEDYTTEGLSVSSDGSVIVGQRPTADFQPFRWTEETGAVNLDLFPDSQNVTYLEVRGLSADGAEIVGYSLSNDGVQAYRWNSSAGLMHLGAWPPSIYEQSVARDISADGQRIVGDLRYVSELEQACYWTEAEGIVTLTDPFPELNSFSKARKISADGNVIAGDAGGQMVRWTLAEGGGPGSVEEIGGTGYPNAVSSDGSVIVGEAYTSLTYEEFAFIWDEAGGMRDLQTVLTDDYGLDLTGWTLTSARDVSDDGLTIVGDGINPNGDWEGWVVRLPEPASLTLLLLASLIVRRR